MEESKLEKYQEEYEIRGMNTYRSDFLEDRGEEINVYELDSNQNMMDLINDKVDEIKESLGINKDINR